MIRPAPADAIRTRHLRKRYASHEAVRDLNLTVRSGEIYGFLGPNGAGKTTTILMLLGIEPPTAGEIAFFGDANPDRFALRRRIGVVAEHQCLDDDMSAWEYLGFFASFYRIERAEERIAALLERLNLYEFRRLRARDFSRGMQQKLGLARALLHRPDLLILDEPVSGLDPHGIRQVREVLLEENRRGVTILVSSHVLSEIERTAHRVGILSGGRLVAEDDVAAIGVKLQPEVVYAVDVEPLTPALVEMLRDQAFVRGVDLLDAVSGVGRRGSGRDAGRRGASPCPGGPRPAPTPVPRQGTLRIRVAAGEDRRRDIAAIVAGQGGLILQLREEHVSLEDAFVQLTADNVAALAGA